MESGRRGLGPAIAVGLLVLAVAAGIVAGLFLRRPSTVPPASPGAASGSPASSSAVPTPAAFPGEVPVGSSTNAAWVSSGVGGAITVNAGRVATLTERDGSRYLALLDARTGALQREWTVPPGATGPWTARVGGTDRLLVGTPDAVLAWDAGSPAAQPTTWRLARPGGTLKVQHGCAWVVGAAGDDVYALTDDGLSRRALPAGAVPTGCVEADLLASDAGGRQWRLAAAGPVGPTQLAAVPNAKMLRVLHHRPDLTVSVWKTTQPGAQPFLVAFHTGETLVKTVPVTADPGSRVRTDGPREFPLLAETAYIDATAQTVTPLEFTATALLADGPRLTIYGYQVGQAVRCDLPEGKPPAVAAAVRQPRSAAPVVPWGVTDGQLLVLADNHLYALRPA